MRHRRDGGDDHAGIAQVGVMGPGASGRERAAGGQRADLPRRLTRLPPDALLAMAASGTGMLRVRQCAPVLAAVTQEALDGGCGPAPVKGEGTPENGRALVA
jgi:hypothetical protein